MQPNFLLITADDMNYNSPGIAGSGVDDITPNLDRLAAEGMRFVHAHVTIAVCQPSRSALLTGRYPHRNGAIGFGPILHDVPTLTEQLHKENYLNGIIGKEDHLTPKEKFCWEVYIRTMDPENGLGRDPQNYYQHASAFFQQAKNTGRPFFLMANSHDPHRPFAGSQKELEAFGCHTPVSRQYLPEEVEVPGFLPELADVRQEVAEYFTSVHRCDETVGEILRALEESGMKENTLVMFLSDNGMAFPFAKTNCYLTSTRTPWIIRWPGYTAAGTVDEEHFISGVDFMPTILEAAGLSPIDGTDGKSFLSLLKGANQAGRDQVFTVFNQTSAKKDFPMRAIQNKKFGYIYNAWSDQETVFQNESQSGLTFKAMRAAGDTNQQIAERVRFFQYRVREEFYDFEQDPDALANLIDEPQYSSIIKQMKHDLYKVMRETNDPVADSFRTEMNLPEVEVI